MTHRQQVTVGDGVALYHPHFSQHGTVESASRAAEEKTYRGQQPVTCLEMAAFGNSRRTDCRKITTPRY